MVARRTKRETALRRTLGQLMKDNHVSIRDVARIGGLPHTTVGSWLQGSTPDNFEALLRICNHFSVSMAYLLTGREDDASAAAVPPVAAVFETGGTLFSGYARIHIEKLIPKAEKKKTKATD